MKSPTISKVEELASVLGVHPMALLALAYLPEQKSERSAFFARLEQDIDSLEG
jgi:hypothetical protein